jgi:predicted protein tyrosine phosphatase
MGGCRRKMRILPPVRDLRISVYGIQAPPEGQSDMGEPSLIPSGLLVSPKEVAVKKVLFVCSRNKLRSPTAEQIFCDRPGFEVVSADVIFVMEKTHRKKVQEKYRAHLKGTRIESLDIPDDYDYMDRDLVDLLHRKLDNFFTAR